MTPKSLDQSPDAVAATSKSLGPVMPIGGAEAKDTDRQIIGRFLKLAGGGQSRILVVPTASEEPEDAAKRYSEVFLEMGARKVDVLKVESRSEANAAPAVEAVEKASGIYITGGDQARLVSLLVGTRVMEAIRLRNAAGVIVAGTSAGASILADHLLVGGSEMTANSNDAVASRSLVELTAGFGLLRDAVIDQHFSARGRIGRLLSAFAATPGLLGLGIDEATAALATPDGKLEVIGIGSVTILDGRDTVSDYNERATGELLSIADVSLHVLAPGRCFNLHTHRPIPFEETTYAGPESAEILAAGLESAAGG
jgi:cyanophycinase